MKDGKIYVAQIIGRVAEGGVEKMITNLYKHIDHNKVVFDFFVENTSIIVNKEELEQYGGEVIIVPSYKHLRKFKKCLRGYFSTREYDVVHANMNTLSFLSLKVAKKCGIRVRVSHSHSTSNRKEFARHIIKHLLRPFSKKYATHYLACSTLAGRWLFGKKFFDSNNIPIINNAIDLHDFAFSQEKRNIARKELNLLPSDKVIGHVGRFCSQKNQEFLIETYKHVYEKNNDVYLLLIGTGETMDKCKEMVSKINLNKVIFLGAVSDVPKYCNAMDCFALPSIYEGLPVVGVEAQANNLKCFFSANITTEAKLLDETEYIPLENGPEFWANRILTFLDKDEVRVQGIIKDGYDITQMSEKLLTFYQQVLNKNEK